ncbi:MAG TPA: hypothetical protein VMQ44_03295 [Candidatus Saccharimonadales bacterium]|nr:hypothetical protein [Candidatus Saccharimonadales bacterium]
MSYQPLPPLGQTASSGSLPVVIAQDQATLTNPLTTTSGSFVYATLLSEALPTVSSSTQIFANAPATTKQIWFTIRTAPVTLRTDGGTATAGANGCDFAPNALSSPYVFDMNQTVALLVRAIQNGGTATGWIIYRG